MSIRPHQTAYCCARVFYRWPSNRHRGPTGKTHCPHCGAWLDYQDPPADQLTTDQILHEIIHPLPEPFTIHQVLEQFTVERYHYSASYNTVANRLRRYIQQCRIIVIAHGTNHTAAQYRRGPAWHLDPVNRHRLAHTRAPQLKYSWIHREWRRFRAQIVIPEDPMERLWSRVYNN